MHRQRGFTLIEMMIVLIVLSIVMGAVFGLLNMAQQRYKAESDVLDAFQGAREVVDQITREVHDAGYPPSNHFPASCTGGAGKPIGCCPTCLDPTGQPWDPAFSNYVASGQSYNAFTLLNDNVAGFPSNIVGCTPGSNCGIPDNFTVIMEEDVDPDVNADVEWVVYTLRSPTGTAPLPCTAPPTPANCPTPNVLWRGALPKRQGGSLAANGANAMADANLGGSVANANPPLSPVVYGVVNDTTSNNQPATNVAAENQKPFRYEFNPSSPTTTANDIRTVYINLILRSEAPDPKTGQYRIITLRASARRFNF